MVVQLSIYGERMSSVSSSVWSFAVCWVVVVGVVGVVGRAGYLSLLHMKSLRCQVIACEIVVVSAGSVLLKEDIEVVFPSLGPSSLFPMPFLLG